MATSEMGVNFYKSNSHAVGFVVPVVLTMCLSLSGCSKSNGSVSVSNKQEVCFDGGAVTLGSSDHYPEEQPVRKATVQPFCLDTHEVSVARYAQFVEATGYKTVAETGPNPADYPGQPAEYFQPGSAVFVFPTQTSPGHWSFSSKAHWKDPVGTSTSPTDLNNLPVTHIAYVDAQKYAAWVGRRLPTEAEWEFAARSGGNRVDPESELVTANIWDGEFPLFNTKADGYEGTAPVGSYAPDTNGLYDLLGNVWEWTNDSYDRGPRVDGVKRYVIKGGSHLCATNFCARFRPEARQPQEKGLGTSHIGFRTARDQ